MKASIAHGQRPTALILGKGSNKPWSRTDVTFAKAYQRFLNELCSQCGYPKYLCHNDDNRIQFKLRRDECASNQIAEREQARVAKDEKLNSYGTRIYAEPYLTEDAVEAGLEFSDFRRPWLIDRATKMGLITEEEAAQVSGNLP